MPIMDAASMVDLSWSVGTLIVQSIRLKGWLGVRIDSVEEGLCTFCLACM